MGNYKNLILGAFASSAMLGLFNIPASAHVHDEVENSNSIAMRSSSPAQQKKYKGALRTNWEDLLREQVLP